MMEMTDRIRSSGLYDSLRLLRRHRNRRRPHSSSTSAATASTLRRHHDVEVLDADDEPGRDYPACQPQRTRPLRSPATARMGLQSWLPRRGTRRTARLTSPGRLAGTTLMQQSGQRSEARPLSRSERDVQIVRLPCAAQGEVFERRAPSDRYKTRACGHRRALTGGVSESRSRCVPSRVAAEAPPM